MNNETDLPRLIDGWVLILLLEQRHTQRLIGVADAGGFSVGEVATFVICGSTQQR